MYSIHWLCSKYWHFTLCLKLDSSCTHFMKFMPLATHVQRRIQMHSKIFVSIVEIIRWLCSDTFKVSRVQGHLSVPNSMLFVFPFLTLMINLLLSSQSIMTFTLADWVFSMTVISPWDVIVTVSSAYIWTQKLFTLFISSLFYIKNSIGSRINHWNNPNFISSSAGLTL